MKGMKRDIEADLKRWKQFNHRMPLLLRGARQVGKSYTVERFGKEEFEYFVLINFEQNPEYRNCFKTLEPQKIINALDQSTMCRMLLIPLYVTH